MQNESPSGNSSSHGDGIYYYSYNFPNQLSQESRVLATRKRLLNQYISESIREATTRDEAVKCNCHYELEPGDLILLDELDQCYRKFDGQTSSSSVSDCDSDHGERLGEYCQVQQVARSSAEAAREGSAFTRLLGATASERGQTATVDVTAGAAAAVALNDRVQTCCGHQQLLNGNSSTSLSGKEAAKLGLTHLENPNNPNLSPNSVAQEHGGQRKKQNYVGKLKQRKRRRQRQRRVTGSLFIDSVGIVQSSSTSGVQSGVVSRDCASCCLRGCFTEDNNNNHHNCESRSSESEFAHRKIYEPPPLPSSSQATQADSCQREQHLQPQPQFSSWPCYYSSRTSVKQPKQQLECGAQHSAWHELEPHRQQSLSDDTAELLQRRGSQWLHGHRASSAALRGQATPATSSGDYDDDDDLDKFDIRSVLDCVEEFSPTWASDVSSKSSSQEAENPRENCVPTHTDELTHNRTALSQAKESEALGPSRCFELYKMGADGIKAPREEDDNNNDKRRETFGGSNLRPLEEGHHHHHQPQQQQHHLASNQTHSKRQIISRPGSKSDPTASATDGNLETLEGENNQREQQRTAGAELALTDKQARKKKKKKKKNNRKSNQEKRETTAAAATTTGLDQRDENKAEGEELQRELVLPNYLEESAATTTTAKAKQGERNQSEGGEENQSLESDSASMRVARDLAKLSVPSLSSLQYLPGQCLDVKPAKMVDRKAASSQKYKNKNKTMMMEGSSASSPPQSPSSLPTVTNVRNSPMRQEQQQQQFQREVQMEENRDFKVLKGKPISAKHDESCLFDRLCLCNCMARNHSKPSKSADEELEAPSRSKAGRKGFVSDSAARATPESCKSVDLHPHAEDDDVVSSSSPSLQSPLGSVMSERNESRVAKASKAPRSRAQAQAEAGGNIERVRDEAPDVSSPPPPPHPSRMRSEKQSPTFLSLLKPDRAHATSSGVGKKLNVGGGGHPLEARAHAHAHQQIPTESNSNGIRGHKHKPLGRFAASNSQAPLGSIDDLEASGRSSSASGTHTNQSDFCSPLSSQTSYLFHKSGRKSADLLSENSECNDQETRGRQVDEVPVTCRRCNSPSPNSNQSQTRKKPAYKRLLSPGRLFASSSQSDICEHCEPSVATTPNDQKSFLSRSLSRLSGRKSKQRVAQKQQESSPEIESHPDKPHAGLHRNSPTHSDSINSLEDISLCQSLPYEINRELLIGQVVESPAPSKRSTRLLETPEIVLSRVEFESQQDDIQEEEVGCSSSSIYSCDRMARSTSGGLGRHHHQNFQKNIHSNDAGRYYQRRHYGNRGPPPQRHGSEISFCTSDESVSLTHGPFSLPSSPRASRRHLARSARLSSSPVPFHSPASESTKIEDGLKVCSTEHFEKHIGNIRENQIEAQKRLFAAWINHYAPNLIMRDLFLELQDGIKLIGLLATLTHDRRLLAEYERLNRDKRTYVNRLALTPSSRLSHISNVHIAIDYMRKQLGMKLVNLNPMDIVSGNENVILGLCWNIILHFQLSGDLNNSSNSDNSSLGSSLHGGEHASRLSSRALHNSNRLRGTLVDEMSSKDLTGARSKLLAHINKRFNLKLTNLTSSLVDGDVLMAIIRQMVPHLDAEKKATKLSKSWSSMSDDDKLECCFQLAQDYLNVPRLISASDLRQQTISERNSKPLLVYLSMLLKANPRQCSTDQMLELRQLDESLLVSSRRKLDGDQQVTSSEGETDAEAAPQATATSLPKTNTIQERLSRLDEPDRFHIDKLQKTLDEIGELDRLIREARNKETGYVDGIEAAEIERSSDLKRQAEQVELLINWINEADKLFEAKQEASSDPAKAMEMYHRSVAFFSQANLPHTNTSLCPTLERQYRECLAAANQHVLCMEQIMKNWISHKQASKELLNWMILAESKLETAFRPSVGASHHQMDHCLNSSSESSSQQDDLIDRQTGKLDDLIDFFELEQINLDDFDPMGMAGKNLFTPLDGRSSSLSQYDLSEPNNSLSGSLISLGSTASRISTLASSKKAAHHGLFDNLGLQSHLLAAQLEPDQRDSILMGVKQFNTRMRHILEYKVPQVISDICLSINRCKMQIKEQEELASEPELDELEVAINDSTAEHISSGASNVEANDDESCREASPENDVHLEAVVLTSPPTSPANQTNNLPSTRNKNKQKNRNRSQSARNKNIRENNAIKKTSSKINTSSKTIGKISQAASPCSDGDECESFYRSLWNKIVRASKMSLSFNIVLLICLAGICVVPLIQRDACCDPLKQAPIPTERFTINQRPT